MLSRLCNPLISQSFFLFGARGTGKSTLLRELFSDQTAYVFDLLLPETELELSQKADLFEERVRQLASNYSWFIIDEVQRLPVLLNSVHRLIFDQVAKFAITGSSARKLRRGAANLLAGRALLNNLYPLTAQELGDKFNLNDALSWGTLPSVILAQDQVVRIAQLAAYVHSYLKEEIAAEQIVRQLDPFRRFMGIAAHNIGKPINFTQIAKDTGVSPPTVQSYFQILDDTLIGYTLDSYHRSIRNRQRQSPKFYLFDNGITRAMTGSFKKATGAEYSEYGALFEQFVINEIVRHQNYKRTYQQNYYLRGPNDHEIDLIVEGGKNTFLIEIKSSRQIDESKLSFLKKVQNEISGSIALCISLEDTPRQHENVLITDFQQAIEMIVNN
jgi:predicted AAA+ superfamily ATPase